MLQFIRYIAAFIILMHGLVHAMYFVSYWPLAEIEEVPYKTTLLFDTLNVGPTGMKLYALLCLLTTIGFVVAAFAFAFDAGWWRPFMAGMAILSLVLTMLNFRLAYGGPVVNIIILLMVWFAPRIGW